ncbi:MAG: transketolase [Salibacteraceae bacterium]|jgi:transketolase
MSLSKNMIAETAKIIRGLSMDGVQRANSGHPGMPMGMADIAAVLWTNHLNHNPNNPDWFNRDRFVLSNGHGSMLIYSLLHLYGYDLTIDDLKEFRQWGSKTPGHPENHITPGIETTTGPLGQGIANAVGMAMAEESLAGRYNKDNNNIVAHYTYAFCGDGDLEEGISHEACSLAGHHKLGKLVVLYDDNDITIDGDTSLSFSEETLKRFEAYGWHVLAVDGHNLEAIDAAIDAAKEEEGKPTLIACKTTIGFGSPKKAGTSSAHGEPLGVEEIIVTKTAMGLPLEDFYVSDEVKEFCLASGNEGVEAEEEWNLQLSNFANLHPDAASELKTIIKGGVEAFDFELPTYEPGNSVATRSASGDVLNAIVSKIPSLIGGSADLSPSNKTFPKSEVAFSPEDRAGRYVHYGIREHAMGAIMNGMNLHGGVIPYSGTFFVFSDYMRPAMRMAALMNVQAIYVLTHDSIGLGEDGPTHQPESHLASLRSIPNMTVIRPMCADETAQAWKMALENTTGPTSLVLTRQNLPVLDRSAGKYTSAENTAKGAYVITEDTDFTVILMASGSEVEIALEAKDTLNDEGIKVRVVSVPTMEAFEKQSKEYKESVFPNNGSIRVAVEAGATMPWYKYVGLDGAVVGMDSFGASAPYKVLYEKFGITAESVVNKVKERM